MRERLIQIVERSFRRGDTPFIELSSGRTSTFYIDMKPIMLDPEGAYLIGMSVLDLIERDVDLVGGLEMGAVPLATAVAVVSHIQKRPISAFFVRKQAKKHGTQATLEGVDNIHGKRVVVVEDVVTTGSSALKAVEAVRAAGGEIVKVIAIVDRREGHTLAQAGVAFEAVLSLSDFQNFK